MTQAALLVVVLAAANERPLQVAIPEGWVDLGPHAPKANFEVLPKEMADQISRAGFAAVAFDFANSTPTFAANFNALFDGVPLPDPTSNFDLLKKSHEASLKKVGIETSIRSARPVVIDDVTCAEFVSDNTTPNGKVTQLVYLMPVGERMLTLTYSSEPDRFADYEPQFRKAALLTTGLRKAPGFDWKPIAWSALGFTALGGVVGALVALMRRRRA